MENKPKNISLQGFMTYFNLIMTLIYVTLGLALLMVPSVLSELPKIHKLPLGLVLVGYGIYRFFKWISKLRRSHE